MYTCPMHPEVNQPGPGNCPKCGMKLVEDRGLGALTLRSYLPLIVVISLISLVTLALTYRDRVFGGASITGTIEYFMIGFFLAFSAFKLMDLKGFAEGYATYDLLARRWFPYGYIYPFLELFFALAMIIGLWAPAILWAELIIMSFSGLGVAIKIARQEQFQCACLGTFLQVPLTKVTLIEDLGMATLAATLLFLT